VIEFSFESNQSFHFRNRFEEAYLQMFRHKLFYNRRAQINQRSKTLIKTNFDQTSNIKPLKKTGFNLFFFPID